MTEVALSLTVGDTFFLPLTSPLDELPFDPEIVDIRCAARDCKTSRTYAATVSSYVADGDFKIEISFDAIVTEQWSAGHHVHLDIRFEESGEVTTTDILTIDVLERVTE